MTWFFSLFFNAPLWYNKRRINWFYTVTSSVSHRWIISLKIAFISHCQRNPIKFISLVILFYCLRFLLRRWKASYADSLNFIRWVISYCTIHKIRNQETSEIQSKIVNFSQTDDYRLLLPLKYDILKCHALLSKKIIISCLTLGSYPTIFLLKQ